MIHAQPFIKEIKHGFEKGYTVGKKISSCQGMQKILILMGAGGLYLYVDRGLVIHVSVWGQGVMSVWGARGYFCISISHIYLSYHSPSPSLTLSLYLHAYKDKPNIS